MYVLICYSLTGLIKGSIHPAIIIITYYLLITYDKLLLVENITFIHYIACIIKIDLFK